MLASALPPVVLLAVSGFDEVNRRVKAKRPAELNRIYVAAEWHGRGVGRALMDRALADAKRAACDRLWLGVWEHNPKAMAFYRELGFEIVGTQSFMLGEERQRDLVMSIALA